jgi:exocyst complex component 4
MTNGSTDAEWEREREKELLAEQLRQKRIKDRVPGRRMNGKAKAGDIDGMLLLYQPFSYVLRRTITS